MNKAFTKEDNERESFVVPARAPLPEGSPNYVTARGLALLGDELKRLEGARAAAETIEDDDSRHHQVSVLAARAMELSARIGAAVLVEHHAPFPEEVRFGAKVRVRDEEHGERAYQIVGVDEADAAHGRYSFMAPLSRALLGKRIGDVVTVRTPRGEEEIELLSIAYDPAPTPQTSH